MPPRCLFSLPETEKQGSTQGSGDMNNNLNSPSFNSRQGGLPPPHPNLHALSIHLALRPENVSVAFLQRVFHLENDIAFFQTTTHSINPHLHLALDSRGGCPEMGEKTLIMPRYLTGLITVSSQVPYQVASLDLVTTICPLYHVMMRSLKLHSRLANVTDFALN